MSKLKKYDEYDFTPTQALILEVLTARYRLGNTSWSLESKVNKSLMGLQEKGFVDFKSASVENASLVWLTDAGVALMFSNKYRSPVEFSRLEKIQRKLRKRAKAYKKAR